ncbi:tetratricopeptide repeat protein [Novimethylophilus kurashikiensis]|nr:tetratricopeptide repeat protein [Novimethylophilus kurashikiensis]
MASKIGRNDPCPCGSGKKHKHCCQLQSKQAEVSGNEPSIPSLLQKGMQYLNAGFIAEAETTFHRVLQQSPKHPMAQHILGSIALKSGDFALAAEYFTRAVKLQPDNYEAHCNLGLALHEQGLLDQAIVQYQTAIKLKPNYSDALYNLHAGEIRSEKLEPAIECLEKVLAINANDNDAKFTLGALKNYQDAKQGRDLMTEAASKGGRVFKSRLDAWDYLKAATGTLPPITGSNIETFRLCIEAAKVNGLILEFGVRHGNTIRQIAKLVNQQVHGFDSFEGLPEVWHHEPKGSYTTKGVIPQVPANVELHVGWFEDTLSKFLETHPGPVRFVNVDCDIYSSTKTVLDALAPRIVPGTVLVFDEYIGNEHWREDEFKAFQEAVQNYGWKYEYICFSLFTKQVAVIIKSTAIH